MQIDRSLEPVQKTVRLNFQPGLLPSSSSKFAMKFHQPIELVKLALPQHLKKQGPFKPCKHFRAICLLISFFPHDHLPQEAISATKD